MPRQRSLDGPLPNESAHIRQSRPWLPGQSSDNLSGCCLCALKRAKVREAHQMRGLRVWTPLRGEGGERGAPDVAVVDLLKLDTRRGQSERLRQCSSHWVDPPKRDGQANVETTLDRQLALLLLNHAPHTLKPEVSREQSGRRRTRCSCR